jgi:general stress protein YciG
MSDPNRTSTEQSPIPVTYPQAAPAKKRRGFAAMDREQVREFARRGGAAAHRAGTAHEFTSEEARAAGRKGGLAARANGKSSA